MTPPSLEGPGREPESGLGTGLMSPVEASMASPRRHAGWVQPALPGRGSPGTADDFCQDPTGGWTL
jgi:hypothetical protein